MKKDSSIQPMGVADSREGFQIKFPDESWRYGNLDLVTEPDLTKMHEAIYLPTDEETGETVNDGLVIE